MGFDGIRWDSGREHRNWICKRMREIHWPCQRKNDFCSDKPEPTADPDSRGQVPPLYNTKKGRGHWRHSCSTCAWVLEFYVSSMSATDIRRERMAQQEEQWKTTPGSETQWHADMEEQKGRAGTERATAGRIEERHNNGRKEGRQRRRARGAHKYRRKGWRKGKARGGNASIMDGRTGRQGRKGEGTGTEQATADRREARNADRRKGGKQRRNARAEQRKKQEEHGKDKKGEE